MSYMISDEKISEIKHSADIIEIVSETVTLKKNGRNFLGLCPFHSEKTPSFTVSPDKQMFYCFGCGLGGNVFTYVMKHEGISFPEAARFLARRNGIMIPEQMNTSSKNHVDEREILFQINRMATEFFYDCLVKSKSGNPALSYLDSRGIPDVMIKDFCLGYARPGWSNLLNFLSNKGIALALIEKAGLITRREKGSGFYDRFRDRLIFPILNLHNQIAGFGGRVIDESLPKYLNSPETPIYSKSRSLYGLFQAKPYCRQIGDVFVAEGYMDLLTLHLHGFKNSVATLGTAMTEEHIRLLRGICQKITLVYDSDQAGIKAALRCIELFNVHHQIQDIRVLVLPDGHDPDTFLRQFGSESFKKAASQASGVFSFLLDIAIKKYGLTLEGKLGIIEELEKPLSAVTDGLTRSSAIKEIAERTGIDESAIQDRIREKIPARRFREKSAEKASFSSESKFESRIIAMMLQFPEIIPVIVQKKLIEYVSDPLLKSTGNDILRFYHDLDKTSGQVDDFPSILLMRTQDDEKKRIIAAYSIQKEEWQHEGCLKLIEQYVATKQRFEMRLLQQKIKKAEESQDEALLQKLIKDFEMVRCPQEEGNYGKNIR